MSWFLCWKGSPRDRRSAHDSIIYRTDGKTYLCSSIVRVLIRVSAYLISSALDSIAGAGPRPGTAGAYFNIIGSKRRAGHTGTAAIQIAQIPKECRPSEGVLELQDCAKAGILGDLDACSLTVVDPGNSQSFLARRQGEWCRAGCTLTNPIWALIAATCVGLVDIDWLVTPMALLARSWQKVGLVYQLFTLRSAETPTAAAKAI